MRKLLPQTALSEDKEAPRNRAYQRTRPAVKKQNRPSKFVAAAATVGFDVSREKS
jgi:hypothetical protein